MKVKTSKIKDARTKLPFESTLRFIELCRTQSDKVYGYKGKGPRKNAAHFLRMAAIDKLEAECGLERKWLLSIS